MGSEDGLATYRSIRESRRIKAEFTVLEQHIGTEARVQVTGKKATELKAAFFKDSVGVGRYPLDLHPSTGGDNFLTLSSLPFQIPLGALIPVRMENLLPGCKNIGTTHIMNGGFRLHPEEWNIGEAVGMVAKFCLDRKVLRRKVRDDSKLLDDLQRMLKSQEFSLEWPKIGPTH